MSFNQGSYSSLQTLSIGNVVSTGFLLYRSHLKKYFLLALKAYMWLFIPIYGWAKFFALTALISRLAFADLVNQPESIASGQRFVNSRLWQYLITMLLIFLLGMGIGIAIIVLFLILSILSALLVGGIGQQGNPTIYIIFGLIAIVFMIFMMVAILWLITRFYLVEVPLSIEDNLNSTSTISRSWELTQGYVWRILLISLVGFLITIPIQVFAQIISFILQGVFTPLLRQNSIIFGVLFFVLTIILSFGSGALILPFWQTLKAVVYYDIRSRKEGLDLKLRDHEI
ncbi:MAG: DUF975 domain-containing protein [Chlorogloeopsis fritschii C42_A2020_084]|uniref:DUF975 domain-containing protein n=1 Tax=Chlorogloeopsis fritschii TaxID=1124 RepID=UPI0019F04CB5|nr:DUF975 domain-containing protein [Chlorogloeopsis fritschii]MBF2007702.1 DUF975 domain-containing protein [Chlorogloeopsis fritschii C42_A2020_084]